MRSVIGMVIVVLVLVVWAAPAFVLALLLTPWVRRLAARKHFVAPVRPDRLHREERPYGGGIAVMIAATAGFAVQVLLVPGFEDDPIGYISPTMGRLAIGGVLFFILGLADDRYRLSAWLKMLLQTACAAVVVLGFEIKATAWVRLPYGPDVLSIAWIVVMVNAYNMLDHADGLAATVGAVALAALAFGQVLLAYTLSADYGVITEIPRPALAAAGALAGFLIYNYPPARLFMGDAGSMLVGYLLAALPMQSRYYFVLENMSKFVVLIPLAILAVPLFDMVCVTLSRIRRRQSPFRGDATSHLAHRMLARGWSPRGIVAFAAGASAVTGGASVAMYFLSGPALMLPWLAVAAVLVAMLLVRRPPRAEVVRGSFEN